jgi:uncharacterized protein (TIGR02271 family)
MAMTLDTNTLYGMRGNNVVDRDGNKIGSFAELYLDRGTGQPEWAAVKTGLFGMNVNLVPLQGVDRRGDDLQVPFDADLVKSAPDIDADQELTEQEEQRLYAHYGLEYSGYSDDTYDRAGESTYATGQSARGTDDVEYRDNTVARDTSGPETDSAMTRSEEELHVGTSKRERGRARLRKYIETDTVTKTVPVEREVARLETEPVTDANVDDAMEGPPLSEEEAEVTLSEEEVVVEKRAVPKERVRLETDVVTEDREVSEDVGRERIEVDDDANLTEGRGRRR